MESKRYLLRIELLNMPSPVWRELMVPSDLLLSDLDEVIQVAMGWMDELETLFEYKGQVYRSIDFMEQITEKPQEVTLLDELLKVVGQEMTYIYDLEENWRHSVILQKILPGDGAIRLKCLGGEGDCPQEGQDEDYDLESFDIDLVNADLGIIAEEFDEDEEWDFDTLLSGVVPPVDHRQAEFGALNQSDGFDEDEEGDEVPEPYVDLNDADKRQFYEAMQLGEQLRELKPWQDLWDQDIFCIKDPETGLLEFVSVLGRGGEVFALHVHHGVEAFLFWKRTMLGTQSMDPRVYLRSLRLTEIEFLNKAEMEPEDLDLYQRISFVTPPRGSQRWVRFRRYHPRAGAPWFPGAEELPRLVRAMRLCVAYLELLRSGTKAARAKYGRESVRGGDLPRALPCFTLTKDARERAISGEDVAAWQFSQAPIDWDALETAEVPYTPTEFELQQLASLPQVDELWEVGAIYLNAPVGTSAGPVLPILSVAIALGGTMEAPPIPYLGAELEIYSAEAIWRGLAKAALDRGCRPAQVDVITALAESTLKPLESLCQTRIVLQRNFQELHELLNMMGSM